MYRVNIEEISESVDHGDAYIPPQWWINFEKYANTLVDWAEAWRRDPYASNECSPVFYAMKGLLRGYGADIVQKGSYTLLFESAEDFLVFKLKWG